MSNPYYGTGDNGGVAGSGVTGVNLDPHVTGNPIGGAGNKLASVTSGHTWLIVALALAILWALGGGLFRSIRM